MRFSLPTVLYFGTWSALLAAPVLLVALIIMGQFSPDAVREAFPTVPVSDVQSDEQIIFAGLVGLVPWGIGAWVLYQVQALFALYRNNRALTIEAALIIRNIGVGLVLIAVAQVVTRSVQSLMLTSANVAGERMLAIQFGFAQVGLVLAAGLMVVIGRSMVEAARAVDDMRGFV
ncbi:hypothetical protein [Marivita sp. XM-24bin2]|jgi:hypothetical protein|uniref:hypothetical protein n=1 Tax=unclassified Marivita TaxID=2632480 RepID=UPI000D7930EA|nr:hypothetical protein [Marivita sp. XM-24bin2]PWL35674.1 MAG: hypothetical protein DCO97_07825 [Marivita sp. XM-24bin2]